MIEVAEGSGGEEGRGKRNVKDWKLPAREWNRRLHDEAGYDRRQKGPGSRGAKSRHDSCHFLSGPTCL